MTSGGSGAGSTLVDGVPVPVEAYLERIDFKGPISVDLPTLSALARAHLSAVPFENLDVAAGIPVSTDLATNLEKIVSRRRGGWCYELNGCFCALLRALGFAAHNIRSEVLIPPPTVNRDHCSTEVALGGAAYLVDVGFGDSFITPLVLDRAGPQHGGNGDYQFITTPQGPTLHRIDAEGLPQPLYRLVLTDGKRAPAPLASFDAASRGLQAEHGCFFRTKPFATRLIDGGPDRVNVMLHRLKLVRGGVAVETDISAEERRRHLRDWAGVEAPPEPPLGGPKA